MSDALERLRALQADDLPVHGGRTLAYVYDSGLPDIDRIGREAVAAAAATNGLDPTAFPSLLRMENDLVGFGLRLLDAPDTARRDRDVRRHRVGAARRADRPRRSRPDVDAAGDGGAVDAARRLRQGGALLRGREAGRPGRRRLPGGRRRHGGRGRGAR